MTDEIWQRADTIAQIVSALGTLAAVIVALYLARHEGAPRLHVTCGLGTLVPSHGNTEDVLRISIVNAGYRDVMIVGLGWRFGFLRRERYYQTLSAHPLAGHLPWKLAPSERAEFMHSWSTYLQVSTDMRRALGTRRAFRWARSQSMRLTVSLSTGEHLGFAIDSGLRNALRAAVVPRAAR